MKKKQVVKDLSLFEAKAGDKFNNLIIGFAFNEQ